MVNPSRYCLGWPAMVKPSGLAGDGESVRVLSGLAGDGESVWVPSGLAGEGESVSVLSGWARDGESVRVLSGLGGDGESVRVLSGLARDGESVWVPSGLAGDGESVRVLSGWAGDGESVSVLSGCHKIVSLHRRSPHRSPGRAACGCRRRGPVGVASRRVTPVHRGGAVGACAENAVFGRRRRGTRVARFFRNRPRPRRSRVRRDFPGGSRAADRPGRGYRDHRSLAQNRGKRESGADRLN
jgi:hypothetical protein